MYAQEYTAGNLTGTSNEFFMAHYQAPYPIQHQADSWGSLEYNREGHRDYMYTS